jgi:hypothetical protein
MLMIEIIHAIQILICRIKGTHTFSQFPQNEVVLQLERWSTEAGFQSLIARYVRMLFLPSLASYTSRTRDMYTTRNS